jgi:glyoxylase-like metal-dependent hydrolase (beta-lactamase superfamily II)
MYQVDTNVYAFVESRQFQEAVSYLVVGSKSAVLWDSGIGLVPLRPVVEQLTKLPVRVMNSHTHFDHVGGNFEFDNVLGMDTPFTRRNEAGGTHAVIASEVAPESFCGAPPAGADTAAFHSRAWKVTRRVHDGDTVDLGGRVLEILSTPGHTPDAAMLLDRAHGFLFTGDSYYAGTIWLFVPETDLNAYQRSIDRGVALAPSLTRLLPAHNTATEPPGRLAVVAAALRTMRSGEGVRTALEGTRVLVKVGDIEIMTSTSVLAGKRSDTSGGSGLAPSP